MAKADDLYFIGNDPGAAKYGNFINYYTFHSVNNRTKNLHPQMFPQPVANKPFLCLDIGCNTGELTRELHLYLKSLYLDCDIQILAVDIDPILIERANKMNSEPNISFVTANVMANNDHDLISQYLKKYTRNSFDVTFCFSVTMWIHINNGDEGLIEFLKFIRSISKTMILESQPWSCYRSAQRRLKKSGSTFPMYEELKIRSNVDLFIENILIETHKKVYESPNSSWNRKIQSFQSYYSFFLKSTFILPLPDLLSASGRLECHA